MAIALGLGFVGTFAPLIHLPYWRLSSLGVDADGPRPIIGRIWSPLVWWLWQSDLNGGTAALGALIEQETRPGRTTLIVSAHWNPDRLFDLLLLEQGFRPQLGKRPDACRAIAETFTRQGATVVHIRVHPPFVRGHREAVTWLEGGLPCVRDLGLDGGDAMVLGWNRPGFKLAGLDNAAGVDEVYWPAAAAWRTWLDPALRQRAYLIWRAPVAAVVAFLNRPLTPQENEAAENVFRERIRLLQ